MGLSVKSGAERLSGTAVAIGNFDGVHLGHQRIIRNCVSVAREKGLCPTVLSFGTAPSNVLSHSITKRSIVSIADKARILGELGAEVLYVEDFSVIKDMSPEEFCKKILIGKLGAKEVFCGFNFAFGKGRSGSASTLGEILSPLGVGVHVVERESLSGETVSSTLIRKMIAEGSPEKAKALLGRSFFIDFPVERGKRLGTRIGFPTVNQSFPEEYVIPKEGVYAVTVHVGKDEYRGVCNIVEKNGNTVAETHLLDFSGDLYGKNIKIDFEKYVREEKKFSSLDELMSNIAEDIALVREYFGE